MKKYNPFTEQLQSLRRYRTVKAVLHSLTEPVLQFFAWYGVINTPSVIGPEFNSESLPKIGNPTLSLAKELEDYTSKKVPKFFILSRSLCRVMYPPFPSSRRNSHCTVIDSLREVDSVTANVQRCSQNGNTFFAKIVVRWTTFWLLITLRRCYSECDTRIYRPIFILCKND